MDDLIEKLLKGSKARVSRLEKILYSTLLDYLVDGLSISDDKIKYTASNIGLINALDKKVGKSINSQLGKVAKYITNGIRSILKVTKKQTEKFDVRGIKVSDKVTDKVMKHAATTVDQKVDLAAVYSELKQVILSEMSNYEGISLRDLRRQLKERIETKGIVNKYYRRWVFDIYSQYERVGADEVRKEIGLRFAQYVGGLRDNSRSWCVDNEGKVFHESEIEAWKNEDWTGKNETGYNPFYDCGGYHCYHRWQWISDELAFNKRPELRDLYE